MNDEFRKRFENKIKTIISAKLPPIAEKLIKLFCKKSGKIHDCEKKIKQATAKLDIEVIPKTSGPAMGFLKYSCNKNPLLGIEIPAKNIARTRLILMSTMAAFAEFSSKKS